MGLFNWLSWQLERRVMMKEMDRLRADLSETERQLYYAKRDAATLRSNLGEAQLLLHDAERGAKLAAEEQDKLKTQLELARSAAGYWETQATSYKQRISGLNATAEKFRGENEILRQQASTVPSVIETTEPAESELERRAWEMFVHSTHGFSGCFTQAHHWMIERDRRRKEQENQNNGPF